MGIPTFFKKIVKDSQDLLVNRNELGEIYDFYIDFNSIIYTVIRLTVGELDSFVNDLSSKEFEDILLPKIIEYLNKIIQYTSPKNLVYIAIDGVPPMAKIIKQRSRRYKSLLEEEVTNLLEKKYKKTLNKCKWSSVAISPGTVFMDRLSRLLHKIYRNNKNVIINDYRVPGEGEQKIIHRIRTSANANANTVVFSPDADLIVLLLMLNRENLFILRINDLSDSSGNITSNDLFSTSVFLSINKCSILFKSSIMSDYSIDWGGEWGGNWGGDASDSDNDRVGNYLLDYAFLTFLCGNDFVPSIYFLKIKNGGLDLLEKLYKKVHSQLNQFLVVKTNKWVINYTFFTCLVKELADESQSLLQKFQRRLHSTRRGRLYSNNTLEQDLNNFQHLEFYDPNHPLFAKYNRLFDRINYYSSDWVDQYNLFFNLCTPHEISQGSSREISHDISQGIPTGVCEDYLKSLEFCLDYYCNSVFGIPEQINWNYYYKYRMPPTFIDLYKYFSPEVSLGTGSGVSSGTSPITPFQLLMIILPRKLLYLLPKELSLNIKKNYLHMYPTNVKIDIVQGTKYIYSEILEHINIEQIPINIVNDILFDPIDGNRNTNIT